jgi:hypothetical protein
MVSRSLAPAGGRRLDCRPHPAASPAIEPYNAPQRAFSQAGPMDTSQPLLRRYGAALPAEMVISCGSCAYPPAHRPTNRPIRVAQEVPFQ